MTEPYLLWALIVGFVIGAAVAWFALGRLSRRSDDVGPEERLIEAGWISHIVGSRGRPAAEPLVLEILELHDQYLAGPAASISPEERDALAAELRRRAERSTPASGTDDAGPVPPAPRRARRKT